LVLPVPRVTKDSKETLELKDHPDLRAGLDPQEPTGLQDLRETWAHPDSQDPQAATDYLADLAYPAHPARLANPVKMASRARLDPPERRVSRDLRVPWDRKDHQV